MLPRKTPAAGPSGPAAKGLSGRLHSLRVDRSVLDLHRAAGDHGSDIGLVEVSAALEAGDVVAEQIGAGEQIASAPGATL